MSENTIHSLPMDGALLQASRMHTRACLQHTLRHDLQVPLNAMHITLDLLAGKLSAVDLVGQRYLRVLEEELQHLSQLLAPAFQAPDDIERRFDLGEALGILAALLPPTAARLGVALRIDPSPAGISLPVYGRRGWLEQAFLNVAVGRLEALGRGGHLHIAAEPVRSGMRVVFMDDGSAAENPPENMESLALRPGENELGLFVAGRVAASFGGRLLAGSGPGGHLYFDLPLSSDQAIAGGEASRAA